MTESDRRRSILDLRAPGRGFWIGLIGSIALHAVLLSGGRHFAPAPALPPVIEARLESHEPRPTPAPEPEAPRNAAKPAPPAVPASRLVPSAAQESTPGAAGPAPVALPAAETNEFAESTIEAIPHAIEPPQSLPGPSSAEAGAPAVMADAAGKLQELPRHIEILYELKGLISGTQLHRWHREDRRYVLETSSRATGLAGLVLSGKMTQRSAGRIGDLGLIPERYEMVRLSGKREILVFNYGAGSIEVARIDAKKGVRKSELDMVEGAQDPLSSIYQLAMVAQSSSAGTIVAAGTKRVKAYPYRVVGNETVDGPLGKLNTLHVTRNDDSGSGTVHLWLSPEKKFLPVRITYSDEDGREWVLQAVSITLK